MNKQNIRIPIKNSKELLSVREAVKAISKSGIAQFSYRVRERSNKDGKYASVSMKRET